MEIYFDNSATTVCSPAAAEMMQTVLCQEYGNPSSLHRKGLEAERYWRKAQEIFASLLRADRKEIYFTSGGTESDNWALRGTAETMHRRGKHIIISSVEHPAISATAEALEAEGYEIMRLPVDCSGYVEPESLRAALREDTILVSVMHVNNEIGTIQPIARLGEIIKENNPETYFHVDAVQSFGKIPVIPKELHADMISISGHKIHGPKGIGLLYVNRRVRLQPLIYGGGQQNQMRSGTDNVPGAAAFAVAAEESVKQQHAAAQSMLQLKKALYDGCMQLEDVKRNGPEIEQAAPHILNLSFLGIRSEVLLHALEEKGIYVSSGSACASHKKSGSPTLTAIGCNKEEIESAIRFSFCAENTLAEVKTTLEALHTLVPMLRRFRRK